MNAGFPELREQLTAPAQLLPAGAEQYKVYYDGNSGAFLIPNARRSWVRGSEQAVRQFLQAEHGVSSDRGNEIVSPIVRTLVEIRRDLSVSYAGKLAGHMAGLVEQNGELILVTDSPRLMEPNQEEFPTIKKFLDGLLEEQRIYFDCWMKIGVESLRSSLIRPGQAIVLAGPKNCGKSVLQNQVITPALGGRSAKPYQFMSGATTFNGNLFEAEHLMIEDDVGSFDIRARRHFGAYLKQFTANEGVQHHAKNRQAMTLKPFWRVSISCNDEPESLMILPPIDESLSDKVIIFQAKKKPMPMPTQTDEIRTEELFWYALRLSSIAKELVRFLRSFEALVGARPGFNGNAARQKSFSMIKEACSIEARHHIVIGLEAQSPIKGLNFTAGNQ
jgi:hypothetical protein